MDLRELLKERRIPTVWTEFLDGFEVEIKRTLEFEREQLLRRCLVKKYDRRTGKTVEEIDNNRRYKAMASLVVDWRGLTPEVLGRILPVDVSKLEGECECSEENVLALVEGAPGFEEWLLRVSRDIEAADAGSHEEEVENFTGSADGRRKAGKSRVARPSDPPAGTNAGS